MGCARGLVVGAGDRVRAGADGQGVYVAEQELVNVAAPSETSVQGSRRERERAEPSSRGDRAEGSDFVPEPLSVTVAVHALPSPTATLPGTQVTPVVVGRRPVTTSRSAVLSTGVALNV